MRTIAEFEQKFGYYMTLNVELICSCLKEGDVYVDIGANTGLLAKSILDNTKLSKAFIIEPVEYLINEAIKKLEGCGNVKFYKTGFSNVNESKLFYLSENNYGYNKIYEEGMEIHPHKKEYINCIKFSDWVKDNSVGKVDFIKIDVEGHDVEVIEGMAEWLDSIDNKPYILFEGNWNSEKENRIVKTMQESYNYEFKFFGRDILLIPGNKENSKSII